MPKLPNHELYAQKQFHHDLGYALFEPDPCAVYDRVRVGDVGYISDGKFTRLFNAFHEADSPVNQGVTLPDDFAPIGERFRTLDVFHSLQAGPWTSERVRAFRVEGAVSASGPINPIPAGAKVKFQCEVRSGAALLMHHPANREKAFADMAMQEYIVANCISWLNMVRMQGRLLQLHDLIFVRDCTLTGDWATAVWNEASSDYELSFNIGVAAIADASASFWGTWEERVPVPKRQGPRCTERNRAEYARNEFDQCIFLKGMRIAQREWYEKLFSIVRVKATEEGEYDIDFTNPAVLSFLKKNGFKIEAVGSRSSSFRPIHNFYDLMAIFIFENSDADLALIDDNDINVFDRYQMDSLESMCDCLISGGNIGVSISSSGEGVKDKVGRIRWHSSGPHDSVPIVTSEQDLVLLDEGFRPIQKDSPSTESSIPFVLIDSASSFVTLATPGRQKSESSKSKKHYSGHTSGSFSSHSYYSPMSSIDSEVISTPPSRPRTLPPVDTSGEEISSAMSSSSAPGEHHSETMHKNSNSLSSSSDDHVIIHVCDGNSDECSQCLEATSLSEGDSSIMTSLTVALEEFSTDGFMEEFA